MSKPAQPGQSPQPRHAARAGRPEQPKAWGPPRSKVVTVVHGYPVIVSRGPFEQALCAANADGLRVQIEERSNRPGADQASVDVVSLFARHLHLLGTSPAHWATHPIR